MSDDTVRREAGAARAYLKRGGHGLTFWFTGKDLAPDDRSAIMLEITRQDEEDTDA